MEYKFIETAGTYTLTHHKTTDKGKFWGVSFMVEGMPGWMYYEKLWKTNPREGENETSPRVIKWNKEQEDKAALWENSGTIVAEIVTEQKGQYTNTQIKTYTIGAPEPEPEHQTTQEYLDSIKPQDSGDEVPF